MSQVTDYTVDNSTGANVRADINAIFGAIATNNSGGSDNNSVQALGFFANTSTSKLQLKNAAGNAFINLRGFDGTLPLPDGTNSAPSLFFDDDPNTGLFSSAPDTLNFTTGGVERMELGTTTIFNEDGADVDFRIEGVNEANLFYVDAGNRRIGIITSSPSDELHIKESKNGDVAAQIENTNTGSSARARLQLSSDSASLQLYATAAAYSGVSSWSDAGVITTGSGASGGLILNTTASGGTIKFQIQQSEKVRIDNDGRVLIGTTTNTFTGVGSSRLQVSGTGADTAGINLIRTDNGNGGAYLQFTKNRGSATQSGDNCGAISWMGHDGTDVGSYLAQIHVEAGATATSNSMTGDIVFGTANGSSITSERMRLDSSGNVGIGTQTPAKKLHVFDSSVSTIRLETGDSRGQAFDIHSTHGSTNNSGTLSIRNEAGQELLNLADGGGTTNQRIDMFVNGSRKFRFDNDGLKFGSDTAAVNALDDYEQGTFTATNTIGATLTENFPSRYVKVGNLCYIMMDVSFSGLSDTAQCGLIQSLPFTSENLTNGEQNIGYPFISETSSSARDADESDTTFFIEKNDSRVQIFSFSLSALQSRAFLSGRRMRFNFCYRTA